MAIRRYDAKADTTITNAYKSNLTTRADDANMGQSDILEVFSIHAQANETSSEHSRVLIKFPIDEMLTDRADKKLPAEGSVKYYLKLFNAPHSLTLPTNFKLEIAPMTRSWEEGYGLDMEDYSDIGSVYPTPMPLCDDGTRALQFDGVDDYVKITHVQDGPLDFGYGGGSSFTMSAWIKTNNNTLFMDIISSPDDDGAGGANLNSQISLNADGFLVIDISDVQITLTDSDMTAINDGYWHNITITLATTPGVVSPLKLYIDGLFVKDIYATPSNQFYNAPHSFGNSACYIGSRDGTDNFFKGTIDDISFWNEALSAEAVKVVYDGEGSMKLTKNSGAYTYKDNLVAWWRMGDGDTLPAIVDHSVSGLDGVAYTDMDIYNIIDGVAPCEYLFDEGATWNVASKGLPWSTPGGDYDSDKAEIIPFKEGYEELEVDITDVVEGWMGVESNYGFIIKLVEVFEDAKLSFYTKKFFARGTEFFYEKPVIEARWNDSEVDDRSNFYTKSNLRSGDDNKNKIVLKNYVNGVLKNIPDPIILDDITTENMKVTFYESKAKLTKLNASVTIDNSTAGLYEADVGIETNVSNIYECWQRCENSLMLRFTSNKTDGTPFDSSIHNISCEYGGSPVLSDSSPSHFIDQSSLLFDGVEDYVIVNYPSSQILDGVFTIDFWINFDDLINRQGIFSRYDQLTTGINLIWTGPSGDFIIEVKSPVGAENETINFSITTQLTPLIWHHVAVTRDTGDKIYFFLNGARITPDDDDNISDVSFNWATSESATGKLKIGGDSSTDYYFKGYIDEFRIIKG